MAFGDPQTLADASAVNQSFVLQSRFKDGSDFVESDATSTLRRMIKVRHSNAGASTVKGGTPLRRHLVSFTLDKFNATTGKTEKAVLNLTLTVDPMSSITSAEIHDLRAFAKEFISTSTRTDQLLRDET